MPRFTLILLAGCALALAGCNPTYNWRESRWPGAQLLAMFPCKPDHGSRRMSLAGQDAEIQMMGCETGADLFAIAHVQLDDPGRIAMAQSQWQSAMLGNMQAQSTQTLPFQLKGASELLPPFRLSALGRRQDGRAVGAQALWFARGPHLYHAVIYADAITQDVADTFFSGIELQ